MRLGPRCRGDETVDALYADGGAVVAWAGVQRNVAYAVPRRAGRGQGLAVVFGY